MTCFKFISIGDLHLGQRRISCDKSINSLKKTLSPLLKDDVSIVFFPGDFFDNLNSLDSKVSLSALLFMKELYFMAKKYNFLIRIVRGTFLHDRNQNDFWNVFNDEEETIKVFNNISFESILGLDIIYIPDGSPKNSISIIKKMLKDRGRKQVDIVVGHGEFEHTLEYGEIPHDTVFKASDFDDIVKGCVLFGHRHSHSVYKKIIYSGSWERFRHGEEKPKGFVSLTYDSEIHKVQHNFHVNEYTDTYKTVDFGYVSDTENLITKYKDFINKINKDISKFIYVQIKVSDNSFKNILQQITKDLFPNIILSFKKTETKKEIKQERTISNLEIITEDNIYNLIYDKLECKLELEEIKRILTSL